MTYKTYEECIDAVMRDGQFLKDMPEQFQTTDLCLKAIQQCALAILHIPDRLKHIEFYVRAGIANKLTICHMPDAVIAELIEIDWRTLEYVPDYRKTVALCKRACELHPDAIHFVPSNILLEALRQFAVRENYFQGQKR